MYLYVRETETECVISFCIQGTQDFLFSPLFGRKFTAETIRENANVHSLLRLQERKHRQLLPRVFLGKWEIFVFKRIYLAKESLHSLWGTVLEEIKFQLHLHITPTPANSSDQLAVSCTDVSDELLCNHWVFSLTLVQERGNNPTPAHNRLPVVAKPQAGERRNF